ncbi:hypothetical protein BU15DRAFT_52645, partial [Melanogaster broomeanus]
FSISYSPLDGFLFLTEMVEFNSRHNRALTLYTFYEERTTDIRNISHLEFHRAWQHILHAVHPNHQSPNNEVIAIIANSDAILCCALTTRWTYRAHSPMSLRNSPPAVANMIQKTGCCRLLQPDIL